MNNFSETYILAYIKRDLPGDDISKCDALMHSSPEFREKVERIEAIYDLSENLRKQKKIDTEKAWARLSRKIAFVSFRTRVWNITRTAAAILFPLFLLHQYVIQPMLKTTPPEMITLVSAPGIVTKAVLPDGSEVWLNAQSELTYPQKFTGKGRTVRLSGEAYFKVVADKKNRFNVVMPDDIAVSAFGTEFNIHAYQDEPDYQVTLARGNIEVETARSMKKETLAVGQKAVLIPQTEEMTIVQADTYVETAWKDGKMVFRREKLETIAQKLSRKFGVVIRLEGDVLKDYEYTATFTDETLEDILDLLKRSAPITYSISRQEQLDNNAFTHRTVTIKSNKR
ncbi:FecR domain-containing protein [uncultured Proteiniphilum sp.]|uniref:FecR family protein n=1 Tax=uncultured Proteiniphilum sp. TaxID=497637 RepID=UPI002627E29F|nr:FecR domain-containing protein [uncultured Proteiniphilum sp.]